MDRTEEAILAFFDEALSSFSYVHKDYFYGFVREKYRVNVTEIFEKYEDVHKALENLYGANHQAIEKRFVEILKEKSKLEIYGKMPDIPAFAQKIQSLYGDHDLGKKPAEPLS